MLALVFVTALLIIGAHAEDCNGHGTLTDGKCVCSQPLPAAAASAGDKDVSGWVGADCGIEVRLLPTTGENTTYCLVNGTTMCWAATLYGAKQPPNFFVASVTLSRTTSGSLKLYGMLAADPEQALQPPVPIVYPHSPPGEGAWDYLIQVSPASPHAVLSLHGRHAAGAVAAQGIYLCASNPLGQPMASFTLRAAGHSCPVTLHANGFISICSSTPEDVRYTKETCPLGVCACTGDYSRPAAPVDADLGFESCSAPLIALPDVKSSEPTTTSVVTHPPDTWRFYNFSVEPGQQHLALVLSATAATSSHLAMYVRPLQPPGRAPEAHVARSDWVDFMGDLSLSLELGVGLPGVNITAGVWYVGINVGGSDPASYTLSVRRSACSGLTSDCAGRGTCDAGTGLCTCTTASAIGADCSEGSQSLVLGTPVTVAPRTFAKDVFLLDNIGSALTMPTVTLRLRATFTTKDPLPAWVTSRPGILISPSNPDDLTPDAAPFFLSLPEPGKEETMELDSRQLLGSKKLELAMWNPLSSPYQVGYTVVAELVAQCLDACSNHGQCSADGRCTCADGWGGATCSVDLAAYGNGTTQGCVPGSRMPVRREEARATCWAPCDPDVDKYDTDRCVDFSCDPTAADGRPQRRAGGTEACVVDLCGPADSNATVTDASGKFVCSMACVCPEDGSYCALDTHCLPGTQRCLDGLVLQAEPDGSHQCVEPAGPGVCEEGSLRLAIPMDGGAAYGVCVCGNSLSSHNNYGLVAQTLAAALGQSGEGITQIARGGGGNRQAAARLRDGTQCGWTSPSVDASGGAVPPSQGVVVCVAGYQVVGAQDGGLPLSDGRKLTSGGRCDKISPRRPGTSGGMVFFWCLFSVALSATLVVAGRKASEWYEERRWDSGDHEGGLLGSAKIFMERLLPGRGGERPERPTNHW